MNGGVEVTVFNNKLPLDSEFFRNDFGMISERIRKELGNETAKVF